MSFNYGIENNPQIQKYVKILYIYYQFTQCYGSEILTTFVMSLDFYLYILVITNIQRIQIKIILHAPGPSIEQKVNIH